MGTEAGGRLRGKVAFITGAAGGIGSATVTRFAEEGAAIVAVDHPAARERLDAVVSAVRAGGAEIEGVTADVTDQGHLDAAAQRAAERFGRVDTVFANAGTISRGLAEDVSEDEWRAQIDVNLGGVWRTVKALIPLLKADDAPGSVTITSSTAGLKAAAGGGTYAAAKHGVVGLARTWAHELGPFNVRVNTVHPTAVGTPLILNRDNLRAARPDLDDPTPDDVRDLWRAGKLLEVSWIDPVDVANAVLFLASDEARYITGVQLPIDAGSTTKWG